MVTKRSRTELASRLKGIRLRNLLEEVRELREVIEDGRLKYEGDFIFDRSYVEALAEDAVERAGRIIHSASVLNPAGRAAMYARYDAWRLAEPVGKSAPPLDGGGGDLPELRLYPEYRMLASVNRWLGGPSTVEEWALCDLLDEVLARVNPGD